MDTPNWLPTLAPDDVQRARMRMLMDLSEVPEALRATRGTVELYYDDATSTLWRRTETPGHTSVWHVSLDAATPATVDPTHYATAGDRVDFDDGSNYAEDLIDGLRTRIVELERENERVRASATRWETLMGAARLRVYQEHAVGEPHGSLTFEVSGSCGAPSAYLEVVNKLHRAKITRFIDGLRCAPPEAAHA